MTVFMWDTSSYDGLISLDAAQRARDEGIVAVVHRLTRQGGLLDPYAGRNLATFRQAGFGLIGAYAVTYTSGGHQQDALTMQQADQVCPWWRTFPGWWWMEDLERWPTDAVPADLGIAIAKELEAGSGRRCSLYASHGQYGDQLRAWTGPLVNADYTGRTAGGFRSMYPGDNWRPDHGSWNGGWSAYSGREPDLLQFTSSATVGGLTTCDVSAYRGTLDQLRALLTGSAAPSSTGGDVELNTQIPGSGYGTKPETLDLRLALIDLTKALDPYDTSSWQNESLRNTRAILAGQAADEKRDAVLLATLQALTAGGTSVDTAAVLARINEVAAEESGAVAELHAQVVDLQARLAAAGGALAG